MINTAHAQHIAKKRFGQNFLKDEFVIDNIIAAIAPTTSDFMVEIGPGLAALTLPMTRQVDHLTVIELDKDLALRLSTHPALQGKLTIIEQDALNVDFIALASESRKSLRVFGNLPYNISTPLMFIFFVQLAPYKTCILCCKRKLLIALPLRPTVKLTVNYRSWRNIIAK